MTKELLRVLYGYNALYLPSDSTAEVPGLGAAMLLSQLPRYGYYVPEDVVPYVNALVDETALEYLEVLEKIVRYDANWAPLRRRWLEHTNDGPWMKLGILIANLIHADMPGSELPCGHFIPSAICDISNYNGCPLCGRTFHTADVQHYSILRENLKPLSRWTYENIVSTLTELAASPLPPDGNAKARMTALSTFVPIEILEGLDISCAETRIIITNILITRRLDEGDGIKEIALKFLLVPDDVLRLLWYRATGELRVPRSLKQKKSTVGRLRQSHIAGRIYDFKVGRTLARALAVRLANMKLSVSAMCANMHSRRGLWVRAIRAMRLTEYARTIKGAEGARLRVLLDIFYNSHYTVWAAEVERKLVSGDAVAVALLAERPGIFARMLFSAMLHCGPAVTLDAFRRVATDVPARLLVTLCTVAETYFIPTTPARAVRIPSGKVILVPQPELLVRYTSAELAYMAKEVISTVYDALSNIYCRQESLSNVKVWLDPVLDTMPVPSSDRSDTIGVLSTAIQGQRFDVTGDRIRLFMHWGIGLPGGMCDMDLSAMLVKADMSTEELAFYHLEIPGGIHSGDIRFIPDNVGAAEYIELDLPHIGEEGWKYVIFLGSAYNTRQIDPNIMVGWMSSDSPMTVDDNTGVSYNPADVQYAVTLPSAIFNNRGIVFGVLDVKARQVIWVEMPVNCRVADELNATAVLTYMERLNAKITLGELIRLNLSERHAVIVDNPEQADIAITRDSWQKLDLF